MQQRQQLTYKMRLSYKSKSCESSIKSICGVVLMTHITDIKLLSNLSIHSICTSQISAA